MKTILLLSLVFSQVVFAKEPIGPTPETCLRSFAKNYVPEYNSANEYILSSEKKDIAGALDVIRSTGFSDYLIEFSEANLEYADAVGAVFNYDDETHIIMTSINVVNDKCQVKELVDINTVDISESKDKTLLAKYFLGKKKNELPGKVRDWLYDEVSASLKGDN